MAVILKDFHSIPSFQCSYRNDWIYLRSWEISN